MSVYSGKGRVSDQSRPVVKGLVPLDGLKSGGSLLTRECTFYSSRTRRVRSPREDDRKNKKRVQNVKCQWPPPSRVFRELNRRSLKIFV